MKKSSSLGRQISIFVMSFVLASLAQAQVFETIYGRKANIAALKRVLVLEDLRQVVHEMEKTQVRIYKVVNKEKPVKNAPLSFLPEVPKDLHESLAEQMADVNSEGALFISWNEICCNSTNILLVSEAAEVTTLFHEYAHHLFEMQNRNDTVYISEEQKKFASFLKIYNARIGKAMIDDYSLSRRSWRENFDGYVEEYSKTFDSSVQGQLNAEEVAIETGLVKVMLEVKSPHFKLSRAKEGVLLYSQNSIINGSVYRLESTLAFMSRIQSGAQQPDSDWTPDEDIQRNKLYAEISQRLERYKNTRIKALQRQVDEAKAILESLEK